MALLDLNNNESSEEEELSSNSSHDSTETTNPPWNKRHIFAAAEGKLKPDLVGNPEPFKPTDNMSLVQKDLMDYMTNESNNCPAWLPF